MSINSMDKSRKLVYLIIVFLIVVCIFKIVRNREKFDSFFDVLSFIVFICEDQTTYSPGFTEKAFDTIRIGMTKRDVERLVGDPLSKNEHREIEVWFYTSGPIDSSFWERTVIFDKTGTVTEIVKRYLAD